MKIKKGDIVKILSGKERGKTEKVLHAYPKINRVLLDGINIVKKHQKAKGRGAKKGQLIEKPMPLHVSNVSLVDPKSGKPARAGYKRVGDKKVRVSKASGMEF
ncbi:50S ribosomal protein L24 [bacterium]|nr:50S ribosomal protein L24 [bacterium]